MNDAKNYFKFLRTKSLSAFVLNSALSGVLQKVQ